MFGSCVGLGLVHGSPHVPAPGFALSGQHNVVLLSGEYKTCLLQVIILICFNLVIILITQTLFFISFKHSYPILVGTLFNYGNVEVIEFLALYHIWFCCCVFVISLSLSPDISPCEIKSKQLGMKKLLLLFIWYKLGRVRLYDGNVQDVFYPACGCVNYLLQFGEMCSISGCLSRHHYVA